MTATCDGETLQMLLNHKNETKKRKTRVGVIVKDVAVLNASATEQHLVLKRRRVWWRFSFKRKKKRKKRKRKQRQRKRRYSCDRRRCRVEKAAPHSQVPQPKAVSAFALQAMKLMKSESERRQRRWRPKKRED